MVNDFPIHYDITLMSYWDLKTMQRNEILLCASTVAARAEK